MKALAAGVGAAVLIVVASGMSAAFEKQDGEDCVNYGKEANMRVLACSRILADTQISTKVRALVHIKRGEAYIMKEDRERALPEYEEGITLDPTNWEGYNGRGTLLFKLNQVDRAFADYNKATELNPKHLWPWINRCEGLTILGRFEEAADQCNKMIQLLAEQGGRWSGISARGILNLKWKKLDLAIADFNESLRRDPKDSTSLYGRGLAKQKKGDKPGASADMNAAVALNPTIAEYFSRYKIQ
jgi:Flp pilus assembly protein TadD